MMVTIHVFHTIYEWLYCMPQFSLKKEQNIITGSSLVLS